MIHRTEVVRVLDKVADIDLQMVPIIKWLWQQGINTLSCCQGDIEDESQYRRAYILFNTCRDLELFLEALFDGRDYDSFRERVLHHKLVVEATFNRTLPPEEIQWEYNFSFNFGVNAIRFCAGVYFPPEDIPEVTARLTD